jgi:lipopolysaccharide biosynthesis regulator YciM
MQIENFALVSLPIMFGLGWLASTWDKKLEDAEDEIDRAKKQKSTFRGLNLLLSEQPDKAIDALVEVAQLDPETVELHFALGSLFRRRGETERAIRVHQHLVNRTDISTRDKDHAAYELGRDFLRAGLLDRAELSLNRVGRGRYSEQAKTALLEMYQIEKDWQKAIISAKELTNSKDQNYPHQIAHFYCEITVEALRRKEIQAAQTAVNKAIEIVPDHIRGIILQGELMMAMQRPQEAIEIWKKIEGHHPAYLPLIADRWMKAYQDCDNAFEGLHMLKKNLDQHAGGELLEQVFKYVIEIEGPEIAEQLMGAVLLHTPSLIAMQKRFEAQYLIAQKAHQEERASDIKASLDLLKQRTNILVKYTCSSCGFRARRFYWQCPGCNHWDVYSPKRNEGFSPNTTPSM